MEGTAVVEKTIALLVSERTCCVGDILTIQAGWYLPRLWHR
jgi:hypothetical protein